MAKLGEVLPMILAGIAGAASPRGAESMTGIANMMNQRSQQKLEEGRAQERLGMAREERGFRREQNARAVKLSDLAQENQEKKDAEGELEKQDTMRLAEVYGQQLVDKWGAEPAVLAQVELMKLPSNNKQTIKSLYESFTDERADEKGESEKLSLDDQAAIAQKYAAQGMTVRFGSNGEMSITASPEKPGDEGAGAFRLKDLTDRPDEHAKELRKAQEDLWKAKNDQIKATADMEANPAPHGTTVTPTKLALDRVHTAQGAISSKQLGLWRQIQAEVQATQPEYQEQALIHLLQSYQNELAGFSGFGYEETIAALNQEAQ